MPNNCAYCQIELDRLMFCKDSHRKAYARLSVKRTTSVEAVRSADKLPKTKQEVQEAIIRPMFRKKSCPKHHIFSCGCKE